MRSDPGGTTKGCMTEVVRFVFWLVARVVRGRVALVAENALLRQQLIAAQRKIRGRIRWTPWERFTIGLAARLASAWRTAVLLVQPETTFAGTGHGSACCGDDVLGGWVDLRRREPRS